MRKEPFFLILLILGALSIVADIAFAIYLGVTISSVLQGLHFLPIVFPSICIALIVINAISIAYAILYALFLRK